MATSRSDSRSPVESVRSFVEDRKLITWFLAFEAGLLVLAFGLDVAAGPAPEFWAHAHLYDVWAGLLGAFVVLTLSMGAAALVAVALVD